MELCLSIDKQYCMTSTFTISG